MHDSSAPSGAEESPSFPSTSSDRFATFTRGYIPRPRRGRNANMVHQDAPYHWDIRPSLGARSDSRTSQEMVGMADPTAFFRGGGGGRRRGRRRAGRKSFALPMF